MKSVKLDICVIDNSPLPLEKMSAQELASFCLHKNRTYSWKEVNDYYKYQNRKYKSEFLVFLKNSELLNQEYFGN